MSNKLEVGKTYTSKNGDKWECIFVRDGKAWLSGLKDGTAGETAYVFNLDGTAVSLRSAPSYNIVFEPVRETVTRYVSHIIYKSGEDAFYSGHGGYAGDKFSKLAITFDTIDGTPDWSTAKVTPCE